MTITVLLKSNYKNCDLYVRHFGSVFEYLVVHKKKLYQNYWNITPVWWKRFSKKPYTNEQLTSIVKMVAIQAHKHIDKLRISPDGGVPHKGR